MKRSHNCGELRAANGNETVTLMGWVDRRRDLGGVIFVDLRDKYGKTQVVFNPEHNPEVHKIADTIRNEFVIAVECEVRPRLDGMANDKLETGAIECFANKLEILNKAKNPPLSINDHTGVSKENDEVKLKYRYLDLRRPWIQKKIMLKSQFLHETRGFFYNNGFEDIETPVLCKSTPEGARDYLVPSRLHHGKFYALPQSPQVYKQILMIAGYDKYFQIAKCFRDEDLRADRQPEFTQIDVEMSFASQDDVMDTFSNYVQDICTKVWPEAKIPAEIPKMQYTEAMLKYGSDKPDLRYDLEIHDVSNIGAESDFGVFKNVVASGGVIRGMAATGCLDFTRKTIDDLTKFVGKYGAKGLVWMRVKEDGTVESQVGKFFKEGQLDQLKEAVGGKPGDMLFFVAAREKLAAQSMGHLRTEIAKMKGLANPDEKNFVWIVDFPMFEYKESEKKYQAMHHPFTNLYPEDLEKMKNGEYDGLLSKSYDLVLNGVELGSGSERIHDPKIQQTVFKALNLSEKEVQEKFGFFVEAFEFGAPPHAGFAIGVDRMVATMENEESIRDYIAFPKNTTANSPMDQSPSDVDPMQLLDVHINVREKIEA